MAIPSPLPQQVQNPPGFGYPDAAPPHPQSLAQQQQTQQPQGQQQTQQQRQLPSSLSDLVSTFEASKEKGLFWDWFFSRPLEAYSFS